MNFIFNLFIKYFFYNAKASAFLFSQYILHLDNFVFVYSRLRLRILLDTAYKVHMFMYDTISLFIYVYTNH